MNDLLALAESVHDATVGVFGTTIDKCYVANEALYVLAGRKESGLTPMRHKWGEGYRESHRWLRGPSGVIIDVTFDQFDPPWGYPYHLGAPKAFAGRVSNDAKAIMLEVRRRAT